MGISRRKYAAHRKSKGLPGGTDAAVRKAISSGRITVEADNTIDPVKADRQWATSTDGAKQRSEESIQQGVEKAKETLESGEVKPVPQAAVEAVEQNAPESGGAGHSVSYAKARAAKEAIAAQMNQLRLQRMRGELVSRKQVIAHVYDLARKERDSWMQMPARKAANMAAELGVDAHLMEQVLDKAIRDHLADLAEVKIDISGS